MSDAGTTYHRERVFADVLLMVLERSTGLRQEAHTRIKGGTTPAIPGHYSRLHHRPGRSSIRRCVHTRDFKRSMLRRLAGGALSRCFLQMFVVLFGWMRNSSRILSIYRSRPSFAIHIEVHT